MRAHLVQFDIAWEDREANFAKVESLLSRTGIDEGDFVLLPEMFDTGFSLNVDKTVDKDGATATFLARLAEDLGVYVQGGRTLRPCHCAKAHNVATVFGPRGEAICEYAKIHPFSFGREPEAFEGGESVVTWRWGEGPASAVVAPVICYDLRFPELFRIAAMEGAEVFAVGANWPDARQGHWRALLVARAIENQAVVLGVNRVGRDPTLAYAGGSIAIGPKGEILGELGSDEAVLSVNVNLEGMREWRRVFPALRDIRLMGDEE